MQVIFCRYFHGRETIAMKQYATYPNPLLLQQIWFAFMILNSAIITTLRVGHDPPISVLVVVSIVCCIAADLQRFTSQSGLTRRLDSVGKIYQYIQLWNEGEHSSSCRYGVSNVQV